MKFSEKYLTLYKYFKKFKSKAIKGGILMLLNVALILPTPLLTMYLIDNVLPRKDTFQLCLISLLALLIIIIKSVTGSFQYMHFKSFNESVIFRIQLDIFEKIQALPLRLRRKMQTGYLMSRVKNDPEQIHSLLVENIFVIFRDSLTLITGITIILFIHWKLALVAILFLPVYAKIFMHLNLKIRNISAEYLEKRAQVSKKVQESLSLIDLYKIFNSQKYDAITFVKYIKDSIRCSMRRNYFTALSNLLIGIVGGIGPIIIIWYGIFEIIHERLLLGELIAFNSYLGYLFGPTSRLVNVNLDMQHAIAAWDRIYDYLKLPIEETSCIINGIKNNILGNISFQNVSYSYEVEKILKNISLEIPSKKTIGIIGESGSGKTTIVSLINLLDTAYTGDILLDNIDIKKYNLSYLREQICLISQEPMFFHSTIFNNITFGNNHILISEVENACKMVKIDEYIMTLPNKYNTFIDERGVNLSLGQKQRIAFARAIVKKPKILILDEPTSNLDINTEQLLFNDIKTFIENRTTIIITHRICPNVKFDLILSLKDGQIIEFGQPDELLENENSYFRQIFYKET